MKPGPLEGVRLTEFTSAWAGPYATCLLGFLGAEIIKVESRMRLDHSRNLSISTGKQFSGPDESEVFNNLNLNKNSFFSVFPCSLQSSFNYIFYIILL